MTYQVAYKSHGNYCYSFIPARFIFLLMSFFGFCLIYAYKVVLSVTIVPMVGHEHTNGTNSSEIECKHDSSDDAYMKGDFDWNESQKALILGGFFYGYVITQIPGGFLAERYGGKWVLGCSILITGILSLVAPPAAHLHYIVFFLVRFGQGLAEGVVFPAANSMIAKWMPKMERSRGTTIVFTGSQIGNVIAMPLAGVLSDTDFLGGWPSIFYILGVAGIIWFIGWSLLIHETPDAHPHISQKEYDYIKNDQDGVSSERKVFPWKAALTSRYVYPLIIAHFGTNWGFLTVLTLLPTYFTKVLHLDIKKNAALSALPYLLQAIFSWIASFVSDKIRQKGIASVTVIRKVNTFIAYFGPGACLAAVALSKCNQTASIAFFCLAMFFNGCIYPGFNSTHVDMAPDFAGTLMGMTNMFGNMPGFLAPLVASAYYSSGHTLKNWSKVFYTSTAVYVVTGLVYLFFATAQLQPWGTVKSKGKQNEKQANDEQMYNNNKM